MRDRSGTVIAFVALGILALGAAALARKLGKKWTSRRPFDAHDVGRWLHGGWSAVRPIFPALLVMASMSAAGELLRIHLWMKANVLSGNAAYFPRLSLPERLQQAANLRALPAALFGSWRKLLPFQWSWPLGFLPILLAAASRRRFPFSSRRTVAQAWLALGTLFLAGWLLAFVSNQLGTAMPASAWIAGVASLLYLLVGYPAFLALLAGNVDESAERRLSTGTAPAGETVLRLAAISAAVALAGFDGAAFAYVRRVLGWDLRAPVAEAAGWFFSVAGLLLGAFAAAAILPACSSPEPGARFLREAGRWWKRDGLFLLAMPLAVTLAAWVVGFPMEALLAGWRSPASPGALLRSDLHAVLGALFAFIANLLAFLLLLGNWLEARDEAIGAAAPAGETPAE